MKGEAITLHRLGPIKSCSYLCSRFQRDKAVACSRLWCGNKKLMVIDPTHADGFHVQALRFVGLLHVFCGAPFGSAFHSKA
jgi:hypothetical protein